jgi:hypothetical protein
MTESLQSFLRLTLPILTALLPELHAAEPTTAARWEKSELIYEQPAASPDAGHSIGNGRMGTMVWTSPEAVHLQINRADVFAVNRDHQGMPGQRGSTTDYCGGIAGIVVQVGGQPFAPGGTSFRQRLSLENAECVIEAGGLQVRCFVSADTDVLVIEVDDRRASPQPLKVLVSRLRKPEIIAGENIATSTFHEVPGHIVLTQRFRERDYHNASALAVAAPGNDAATATSHSLVLPASTKKRVILISSAAAWQPDADVAGAAVASSGSELAVQAWWRYRCTGDREWLRTHAYPLLLGTVEFYRHLVKKESDGRYHLTGTHAHEDFWGVGDSIMDLAAIRGTAPLAIRSAEILGVDPELRGRWKELLENLAPYPMGTNPRAKALKGSVLADDVWAAGYLGEMDGQHNPEDVWLTPVFPFEDWTLETRDARTDAIVQKTLDLAPRHASVLRGAGLGTAIRTPIAVARAGRAKELPKVLERYHAAFAPLPNGMSLFEGPTSASVEHLGLLSMTLQEALMQSVSPRPGEPEVIRVFAAWPGEWEASFRLLARGGFLVTSGIKEGKVEFVEIESRLGEECRLRNPWGAECLLTGSDEPDRKLAGDLLRFSTRAGKRYRLSPP